jgi:hypothetical protein
VRNHVVLGSPLHAGVLEVIGRVNQTMKRPHIPCVLVNEPSPSITQFLGGSGQGPHYVVSSDGDDGWIGRPR